MKYIDEIYGEFEFLGILEALINTKVLQRLKNIHQGGAIVLVNPQIKHTRLEHSIGVMLLIQKLGGSIEEQIAGLIHDVSHTAFSHLIDYVLEIETEDYHEKRWAEVLNDPELNGVFKQYGYQASDFYDIEKYQLLEYPLPNLCADRIDYTLRDLYQLGALSPKEVQWFLEGLQVFENRIVLKSEEYGNWFQAKYDFLCSDYFGGKANIEINLILKKIIKECMEKGILVESDFYKDDFYLLEKINAAFHLKERIDAMSKQGWGEEKLNQKKRWINPEILVNNRVLKLSELQ